MKIRKKHLSLNVFLFGFIFLSLFFIIGSTQATFKLALLVLTTFVYLIWAYLYHHLDKTMHTQILIEYFLLALLMIILFTSFVV